MVETPDLMASRQAARSLAWFAAALLAVAFAWFAYVDAPLVELALLLFAAGTASAAVAIMAALYSIEATLQLPPASTTADAPERRGARSRRLALLCLALALLLLLGSATLTLGLQGQGGDQQDDTAVST